MQLSIQQNLENGGGPLGIARRHLGWILGPAFTAIVLSVVGAYLWPDTFRSTAAMRYQSSASQAEFEKELDERTLPMLGRAELKKIIDRYELYPGDLKRIPLEDVIENMKKSIQFGRVEHRDTSRSRVASFTLSFQYRDRFKAQKVVQELVALVMAEKQKPDTSVAPSLSPDGRDAARKELEAAETKITEFRSANEGRLPDQAAANQEAMSSLRTGLAKVQNEIARVTREQAKLQAGLAVEQDKRRSLKTSVEVPEEDKTGNPQLAVYDAQILAIEDQIKSLKVQYTDNFPDVKSARQRLEKLEGDRNALAKEEAAKLLAVKQRLDTESARTASTFDAEIKRVQTQVESKAGELEKLNKESLDMDRNVRAMTSKLDGSSDLEKQYAELLKERDLRKSRYDEEEIRYQASRQAVAVVSDRRPQDSVELLDAASLPVLPIEPNRGFIIGAGSALGLVAGLVLAAAREAHDRSLRNLYGIPAHEMFQARTGPGSRWGWVRWAVALVAGTGAMAASVIHYYSTRV